jgi:ArsR family transcriptional regulator
MNYGTIFQFNRQDNRNRNDIVPAQFVTFVTIDRNSCLLLFAQLNLCSYMHTYKGRNMISPALTEEITALHAGICSALADPRRILILYALNEKPSNVSDIAEALGISQPTASRHLNLLRERGLVTAKREGQSVVNTLADQRIIQALDLLREVLASNLQSQAVLAESVAERKE